MPYHWNAISCEQNIEIIVGKQLQDHAYEDFYLYISVGIDSGAANTQKPLFLGYMFIKVDFYESGLLTC